MNELVLEFKTFRMDDTMEQYQQKNYGISGNYNLWRSSLVANQQTIFGSHAIFPEFLITHTHFMLSPVAMCNGHTITAGSIKVESLSEIEKYMKEKEAEGSVVFVYCIFPNSFFEMTPTTTLVFRCGVIDAAKLRGQQHE